MPNSPDSTRYSYKAIISSNMFDLHGVLLRETLRKELKKEDSETSGVIKNIIDGDARDYSGAHAGDVYIDLCISKDKLQLETILREAIKKTPGFSDETPGDLSKIKIHISTDSIVPAPQNSELKISYAPSNLETVWALKGAGKIFLSASNIQKEMLVELKGSKAGRLQGLNYEISKKIESLSPIFKQNSITREERSALLFNPALKQFILDCPVSDDELINKLGKLLRLYEPFNLLFKRTDLSTITLNDAILPNLVKLQKQLVECQEYIQRIKEKMAVE